MALDRAAMLTALEAKIRAADGVRFVTRREKNHTQCPTQPAVVIIGEEQSTVSVAGEPNVWRFTVTLRVYARVDPGGDDSAPDASLNAALLGLESALEPAGGKEVQDLGGLCHRCSITGEIPILGGSDDGGQYVALVPVEILASA